MVVGNGHPASGVLQIERMTEEHVPSCAGIMLLVPKGVWQGSDKRDVLLGFFARGTTTHCTTTTTHPKIIHGDESDLCQYHDNDRAPAMLASDH